MKLDNGCLTGWDFKTFKVFRVLSVMRSEGEDGTTLLLMFCFWNNWVFLETDALASETVELFEYVVNFWLTSSVES